MYRASIPNRHRYTFCDGSGGRLTESRLARFHFSFIIAQLIANRFLYRYSCQSQCGTTLTRAFAGEVTILIVSSLEIILAMRALYTLQLPSQPSSRLYSPEVGNEAGNDPSASIAPRDGNQRASLSTLFITTSFFFLVRFDYAAPCRASARRRSHEARTSRR